MPNYRKLRPCRATTDYGRSNIASTILGRMLQFDDPILWSFSGSCCKACSTPSPLGFSSGFSPPVLPTPSVEGWHCSQTFYHLSQLFPEVSSSKVPVPATQSTTWTKVHGMFQAPWQSLFSDAGLVRRDVAFRGVCDAGVGWIGERERNRAAGRSRCQAALDADVGHAPRCRKCRQSHSGLQCRKEHIHRPRQRGTARIGHRNRAGILARSAVQ